MSVQGFLAGFTRRFCGVPKSVPIRSSQTECIELSNLLLILVLAARRRFFKP